MLQEGLSPEQYADTLSGKAGARNQSSRFVHDGIF
jgi:hypothetical protein